MVEAAFRPAGEVPRSLLDFVDEHGVETMRDSLKESIRESKVGEDTVVYFMADMRPGDTNRVRYIYSCIRQPPSRAQILHDSYTVP